MSKQDLDEELAEVWELIAELKQVSQRLETAADKAIEKYTDRSGECNDAE